MEKTLTALTFLLVPVLLIAQFACSRPTSSDYDIVISNGTVIDPETNLEAIRNVGITNGLIQTISAESLTGRATLDATGLVVAPGFIDLHSHGQDAENYRLKAMDGVTTALELEVGTADVDRWYAEREGKALIHYGAGIGHIPVRMSVMRDPGTFLPSGDAANRPASEAEIEEMKQRIERGLRRGAPAVGFGVAYTPFATRWEILEMFRVAAKFGATAHVHVRNCGEKETDDNIRGIEEVIAASAVTGASLHVVHINSCGLRATPQLLQLVGEAKAQGLTITTEAYPYTAGMTEIKSALFDEGWREKRGLDYKDLQWPATGERLNAESFGRYRKAGGWVIIHMNSEEMVRAAVVSPLTAIASDSVMENGKGHPRSSGTYSRILGRYVREAKLLTLMDAIRKMSLLPAQVLERRVPMMKNKGRIRVGADADLTIFDPEHVIDKATYEAPANYSEGIKYVLVTGTVIVKDGQLQEGVAPGKPVRAAMQ